MVKIAVLVNPYSGRDIRRVSSYAKTVTNWERIRVLRMFIKGVSVTPVDEIMFYPDPDGISEYIIDEFREKTSIDMYVAEMKLDYSWRDSMEFTRIAWRENVKAMLVLGGDGTARAVAKAYRDIPFLPISMGTNNVIPYQIDPTYAGIVVGYAASRNPSCKGFYRAKSIVVEHYTGEDLGLVDLAFTTHSFIGARAVLDLDKVREIYITMGTPINIGLTSILGYIRPIDRKEQLASRIVLGRGFKTMATLAPGLLREVSIRDVKVLKLPYTEEKDIDYSILSFDGERDLVVKNQRVRIIIDSNGPPIIDPYTVLQEIVKEKIFIH